MVLEMWNFIRDNDMNAMSFEYIENEHVHGSSMNILGKISMNIVKWLIDSQERNRNKMLLLLKEIEQQTKQHLVCSLLEMYGNVEDLDIILYTQMRDICRYELKDESLIKELDCYKKLIEKYK